MKHRCKNYQCSHQEWGQCYAHITEHCDRFIPPDEENGRCTASSPTSSSKKIVVKKQKPPVVVFDEGKMIMASDANHPITHVAASIMDHYGCGWGTAEDMAMQVWNQMKVQGWTLTPPEVVYED